MTDAPGCGSGVLERKPHLVRVWGGLLQGEAKSDAARKRERTSGLGETACAKALWWEQGQCMGWVGGQGLGCLAQGDLGRWAGPVICRLSVWAQGDLSPSKN